MLHLYGIPNCDTVKKATTWLNKNNVPYVFHDFKKEGITTEKLKIWSKKLGWQKIFNTRSSTWKNIRTTYNDTVSSEAEAIDIMMENNSIIKRPVIEFNNKLLTGFDENEYIEIILKQ